MFPRIDKGPIEYTLDIQRAWNKMERQECIRFQFKTMEEFNHFQYEISVDHALRKGSIEFLLRGLTTKGMLLPGSGQAESSIDLSGLEGKYRVAVSKPGPITMEFTINITPKTVRIVEGVAAKASFLVVQAH